jgi:polyphenol oxidase
VGAAGRAALALAGGARGRFTGVAEGDLAVGPAGPTPELEARRRAVVDLPWVWVRQVHGGRVVVVDDPAAASGVEADALVTAGTGMALAVHTADCAPVLLAGEGGVVGAVHAGWRGLAAGVVDAAVQAMRALGAGRIEAVLGPCIHPGCYEFGASDLDAVAGELGPEVRSTTVAGRPALDVPAAVRQALARAGVDRVDDVGVCTACSTSHWSHRARADAARQAAVIWRPADGGGGR